MQVPIQPPGVARRSSWLSALPSGIGAAVGRARAPGYAKPRTASDGEALFRLLSAQKLDMVVRVGPDGRWRAVSPAAQRLFGVPPAALLGSGTLDFVHPDDRQIMLARIARLRSGAEEDDRPIFRIIRPDGAVAWVEAASHLVFDQVTGWPDGHVSVLRDISGRVVAETQLRASAARMRQLLDGVADHAIYFLDPAGHVMSWNAGAARVKGYDEAEIIGQSFEKFFSLADLAGGEPARLLAVARERGHVECEGWRLRKDGSRFWAGVAVTAVRDGSGDLRGFVKVAHDLTSRQADQEAAKAAERQAAAATNARLEQLARHLARARDKAELANQAKSRFLTGITHELRTPLNGILGYAQLLRLQGGLNPLQSAHVGAMLGAGEHLLGMINAVLDLSQIESDLLELRPAAIDLPTLGRACLDVLRPAAQAKGLALDLTMAPTVSPRMDADATRLRQVLVNLLANAVKFTATGRVDLRLMPGQVTSGTRLEVVDTGPGIPAEHRPKLFREFERLELRANRAVEGSGLGLAITARLVERMGGQIGYADNPGGGSVFWIELPPTGGIPVAHAAPPVACDGAAKTELRILVVDDVAMNRDIASALLRMAGHDVTCAESGQSAIDSVAANAFDVVLMDVRMPGMDGLEATRRIRALAGSARAVPVVAVTAQAFSEQIERCREAGMDGHVSKPLEQKALLGAISTVLERRGLAPELPCLDETTYRATSRILSCENLEKHLRTLIRHGEALLARLEAPGALADAGAIAEAAHLLGGSAGAFGFRRLAAAGGRFEYAVLSDAPEIADLADQLASATALSLTRLRQLAEGAQVAA
jgi:PAS domain S-box-containing protein